LKKNDFLKDLKRQISFLPRFEQNEVLDYYDEIITDAIENGKNEDEFIYSLGSIEEIIYQLKKDNSLLEKVKSKSGITVREVFSLSVKMISYFIFFVFVITLFSIGFSFAVSGIGLIVYSGIMIFVNHSLTLSLLLFFVSIGVFGLGLFVFSMGLFKWFLSTAKEKLNLLFHRIEDLLRG